MVCTAPGLLLAGCGTGAVEVSSPDVSDEVASVCASLLDGLPEDVNEGVRREVTPADALGAAWGSEDPIVLVCGVPAPEVDPFGVCVEVGGVGWLSSEAAAGDQSVPVVLTTAGGEPPSQPRVQLTVPASQRPEGPAAAMAELAPALKAALGPVPCD